VNGAELFAQEFRDALLLRHARGPPDLPPSCDGCNQKFSIRHALECKKGGLVISRHNEIRDELSDLASEALTPSAVRDEPKIHACRNPEEKSDKENQADSVKCLFLRNNRNEDRGDILIRGLWSRSTDCMIDVQITDVDAKSNRSEDSDEVSEAHERKKKKKQLRSVIVAIVSICGADVVVFPWHFSFMDAMCDLSAKNARVFKLIRRSSSPWGGAVSDGGWGVAMSRSCSFATGWFVCFAGGERRIMMSAGRLAGASGMSPVGSMTVSHAVFVRLVSVSNGRSVIANVFVMASCAAVLEVRRHPNAWSPYLSNAVPHVHFPG
jgi:hypothetical protein